MLKRTLFISTTVLALAAGLSACGDEEEKKEPTGGEVVSGFEFEISVEPSTFAPAKVEPVRIASDGSPDSNPPGTVQLYTPNDTLTWLDGVDGDIFSFDVILSNFYTAELCDMHVVVDSITPADGREFVEDDRGTAYAGEVTGIGVWSYGDVDAQGEYARRWKIKLRGKDKFTLKGKVLADADNCGASAPED